MDKIDQKVFYRIGEVSDLARIKPHVLRYWETEFSVLRPQKSSTNQRLYTQQDIEIILLLKKLLYEEGFTIAGARAKLSAAKFNFQGLLNPKERDPVLEEMNVEEMKVLLLTIRKELVLLRQILYTPSQSLPATKPGQA